MENCGKILSRKETSLGLEFSGCHEGGSKCGQTGDLQMCGGLKTSTHIKEIQTRQLPG